MSCDISNPLNIPDFSPETEYPDRLTARYELLELLSDKGSSCTLLVKNREDGMLCIAKCYDPDSPLFCRTEPEVLKTLSSPLLPNFVEEIRDDRKYCVLREYIPGESLDRVCRNRRFSDEEIIHIGVQLCGQLLLLHSLDPPVIHRDIKPENVILRPDGRAVLIDFGIAREYRPDSSDTFIMGTRGFAAPEQYGFSQTDERSDIYSLGMLLSCLRQTAQEDRTVSEKDCALREERTKLADRAEQKENTGLRLRAGHKHRDPLSCVIQKCCSFDPSDRYQNVSELQRALKKAEIPRTPEWYVIRIAAVLVPVLTLAAILYFYILRKPAAVTFRESAVEETVRLQLSLPEGAAIPADRLSEISGLYIVNDLACADEASFYEAVNQLYTSGQVPHGTMSSLEDVSLMPSLTQVCVAAEALSDIEALTGLEHLEKVEIKHNYVEDISPLSGLPALISVGINDNPVTDLTPLENCPALAFLDLCDVRSYDPSILAHLGDFHYLDLANPTESYRFLAGKQIRALRLAWTSLSSLEDLASVSGLEELDISHTSVKDLSSLDTHENLKHLNLSGLSLNSLNVLNRLPFLETVTLSRDMEPLIKDLQSTEFTVIYE